MPKSQSQPNGKSNSSKSFSSESTDPIEYYTAEEVMSKFKIGQGCLISVPGNTVTVYARLQAYQERKDDVWFDLMEDFAKQVNENNVLGTRYKEEIKEAMILIKSLS